MKVLLTATALLLALLYGIAGAQTCVQADLTHPTQATITWQDNSNNETGFVLERQLNGGAFVALAPIAANTTQVIDATVVRSTVPNTYTYRLKAILVPPSGPTVESTYTAITSASCITFAPLPPAAPNAPSGFSVSSIDANTLRLSWDDTANEANYEVWGRQAKGSPKTFVKLATLPADTTTWDWTGRDPYTTYCNRIRGTNLKGNSNYTPTGCATTMK